MHESIKVNSIYPKFATYRVKRIRNKTADIVQFRATNKAFISSETPPVSFTNSLQVLVRQKLKKTADFKVTFSPTSLL
jgi:hypothetical protein